MLKEQNSGNFGLMIKKIRTFLAEDQPDKVLHFAAELGFDPTWLMSGAKKQGKKPTPGPCVELS